jgi:hypothetical protein
MARYTRQLSVLVSFLLYPSIAGQAADFLHGAKLGASKEFAKTGW